MKRLAPILPLMFALAVSSPAWAQQQTPAPTPPAGTAPPPAPDAQPAKSYSGGMTCGDDHKCTSTGVNSGLGKDNYPGFSPSDLQQKQAPSTPATANPFPEAISKAAAAKADKADAPPEKQGDKDYSSSDDRMKDMDVLGNSKPRIDDGSGKPVYDPKLGKKDDKVGVFYMQMGNYAGAYLRFKEATEVNPGDAEAVFGLAQASQKLGKRQEATQNYEVYVDAFPNGPRSKDVRKALKELAASH